MPKYNLRLTEDYSPEIEHSLVTENVKIRHIDKVLKNFIIIEAAHVAAFKNLDFVKSYKKTRRGSLLEAPKKMKNSSIKVSFTPNINSEPLKELGLYGIGNKIAVIDSGYDVDQCGIVEQSKNFSSHHDSSDTSGHGTLVISILKNFAPSAKIYSAKVCVNDNDIDEEDVFRALDWIMTLPDVRLVNLSLGMDANCQGDCDLAEKINAMSNIGFIFVVAMGNNPKSTAYCPACAESAISVGALNEKGNQVANFSSKGHINSTKPSLIAPSFGQNTYLGVTHPFRGTSFAAPVITGILGATHKHFENNGVLKEHLISSCDPLIDELISKQGSGKINLQKFLGGDKNEENEDKN